MPRGVPTPKTVGHVYIVSRVDLMKCYIGQSTNEYRRFNHLKPHAHNYRYEILCGDGTTPDVELLEDEIPVEDLDKTEREWMQIFEEEGWELINRRSWRSIQALEAGRYSYAATYKGGSNENTSEAKIENARNIGLTYGSENGKNTQQRYRNEPELAQKNREAVREGQLAGYERREADPELMEKFLEDARRGGNNVQEKHNATPESAAEWKEKQKLGGYRSGETRRQQQAARIEDLKTQGYNDNQIKRILACKTPDPAGKGANKTRRRCEECGMVSIPGNITRHQTASGHTGFTIITDTPEPPEQRREG